MRRTSIAFHYQGYHVHESLFAHVSYVVFDRCPTMFSEPKTARLFSAAAMWLGITFKKCLPRGHINEVSVLLYTLPFIIDYESS